MMQDDNGVLMSAMDATSSFVYSLSRPLHPMQPQTTQYLKLEEYAYQRDIQVSSYVQVLLSMYNMDGESHGWRCSSIT